MQAIKCQRARLWARIRSELSRIDLKCALFGAIAVLLVGFLSSIVTGPMRLFSLLEKPKGTPPAFLFPIIWTVLYALIGAAAGAIFCAKERAFDRERSSGLLFFVVMLVFNFIWSPLFFGAGAYFAAFLAILIMIILTVLTVILFSRIYLVCGIAMGIYLAWLIYAAYLNLGIIILN